MVKYILKRLLMIVPVILGITFLIFLILSLAPGDPARIILGDGASVEDVMMLREDLGLNQPLWLRYMHYIQNALHGDFGTSYRTGLPVFQEIFGRFPITLALACFGILIAVCLGIPIGIISAVKQNTALDGFSMLLTLLLTSMPGFWLGLLLMLFFSLKLNILPATGAEGWTSFILPSVTISAGTMAVIARMMRTTMLEVIRQDYIRTARAKGATERRVLVIHALKNALIPVLTVAGMNFGALLGGTVLIESVFALPGVGTLLVNAIRMKDIPIVMADIMFIAVCFSVINLLVDILYGFIDPRIKALYR